MDPVSLFEEIGVRCPVGSIEVDGLVFFGILLNSTIIFLTTFNAFFGRPVSWPVSKRDQVGLTPVILYLPLCIISAF